LKLICWNLKEKLQSHKQPNKNEGFLNIFLIFQMAIFPRDFPINFPFFTNSWSDKYNSWIPIIWRCDSDSYITDSTHGSLKPIIVISSLKLTLLLLCLGRISILQSEESDESEVLPWSEDILMREKIANIWIVFYFFAQLFKWTDQWKLCHKWFLLVKLAKQRLYNR